MHAPHCLDSIDEFDFVEWIQAGDRVTWGKLALYPYRLPELR